MLAPETDAQAWALVALHENDIAPSGVFEPVRAMPWSDVSRINTNRGWLYLKRIAPLFTHEPAVLRYLNGLAAPVPRLLAENTTLHCCLLFDAGEPLRPRLLQNYEAPLMAQALRQCAAIQRSTIPHITTLHALGVPDWRPQRLAELLQTLLHDADFLAIEPMSAANRTAILAAIPKLERCVEELCHYALPTTLEHGDFHDNNILLHDNRLTINDWGDSNISHPFFALASVQESAGRHHGFNSHDEQAQFLQTAYLGAWQDFGTAKELNRAFALALRLRPVQFAINFSRILKCCAADGNAYLGVITERLMLFANDLADVKGSASQSLL